MPEFDERSVNRIVNAVRWVEGQPRGEVPRGVPPAPDSGVLYATTTGVITAKSGTTLGKGPATLEIVTYSSSGVGTIATSSYAAVTIYLNSGTAITTVGSEVAVVPIGGKWNVLSQYC